MAIARHSAALAGALPRLTKPAKGGFDVAEIEFNDVQSAQRVARTGVRMERIYVMLFAAGLASLTIVAVAATIMTTLL